MNFGNADTLTPIMRVRRSRGLERGEWFFIRNYRIQQKTVHLKKNPTWCDSQVENTRLAVGRRLRTFLFSQARLSQEEYGFRTEQFVWS